MPPHFDSPPLFYRLLDRERGGHFTILPEHLFESRQFYEPDSPVLVMEMQCLTGRSRLTDYCPVVSGADLPEDVAVTRRELVRSVTVLQGTVRLRIERGGGAEAEPRGGPSDSLHRAAGSQPASVFHRSADRLAHVGHAHAITLKENGAIVAAPTSSLPEFIGGSRNWDYRYAWVRDAAFSVYALHRIGLSHEAAGSLAWVLDAVERDGRPHLMCDLEGRRPSEEREEAELEGYRAPSRFAGATPRRCNTSMMCTGDSRLRVSVGRPPRRAGRRGMAAGGRFGTRVAGAGP